MHLAFELENAANQSFRYCRVLPINDPSIEMSMARGENPKSVPAIAVDKWFPAVNEEIV